MKAATAAAAAATETAADGPLAGRSICVLVGGDVIHDARVRKEARALRDAGASVRILGLADVDRDEAIDGIPVRLFARPDFRRVPRAMHGVAVALRMPFAHLGLLRTVLAVPADAYHCHEIFTLPVGMTAARLRRVPFVYDAHELYTELAYQRGPDLPLRRWLERSALRRAGLVIAPSLPRARVMHEEYGARALPLVIRNVPLLLAEPPHPSNDAVAARAATGTEHLLIYQGSLSDTRGLDAVIEALRLLPSGYHLALMGPGAVGEKVARALDEAPPGRVHRWPAVPADRVSLWAAVADAGVVTYAPDSRNNLLCVPNKLHEYAAAGIPVIATDLPGLRHEVEDFETGVFFAPGDPASFADAVTRLFGEPGALERARAGVRAMHRASPWQAEARRLVEAYARLLGTGA